MTIDSTKTHRLLFLSSLLLWTAASPVHAQRIDVIAPTGQWVTDNGSFLSPSEQRSLTLKLASYADTTSTQIVIVTLPTLNGVPAADYAVELGRIWGVGQAGYDNGVVILVSRDDRQIFIATGYGLEGAIPDAVASRVYRNILVPHFRRGEFYEGLSRAVDALIDAARGEFSAADAPSGDSGMNAALVLVLLVLIAFIVYAIIDSRRRGDDDGFQRPRRRRRYGEPPIIIWGGPGHGRSGTFGGGGFGGFGGGGFGGFGGGGGSFGGGGAGGGW